MMLSNELLSWWIYKWRRYNVIVLFSGIICLLLLYLAALYFKRSIYFFFMIPSGLVYLIFLNIVYFVTAYLYFFSTNKLKVISDNPKNRSKVFNILLYATIILNCLALIACLLEFRILI